MSAAEWSIREYRPGDEERIVPFFNHVFGSESEAFEPRITDFWKWQFADNPLGHHTMVAEDASGRLIGNYSGIRMPFLCKGARIIGSQCVDTCVDAGYRGRGLFVDLANAFFSRFGNPEYDKLQYGYPNPPALRVGSRHLGYRPIHTPIFKLVVEVDSSWADRVALQAGDL